MRDSDIAVWCSNPCSQMKRSSAWKRGTFTTPYPPNVSSVSSVVSPSPTYAATTPRSSSVDTRQYVNGLLRTRPSTVPKVLSRPTVPAMMAW